MNELRLLIVTRREVEEVPILAAWTPDSARAMRTAEPDRALSLLAHVDVALLVHEPDDDWILSLVNQCVGLELPVAFVVVNVPKRRRMVLHYLLAGVNGYTFVDDPPTRLDDVIMTAWRGELNVDPRMAALIVDEVSELRGQLDRAGLFPFRGQAQDVLSPREHEILELIAMEDLSNREIADRLFIEVGTVKNHVHSILHKLGVRSREQAARLLRPQRHEEAN